MNFGVVVFPGSNCDDDMMHVLGTVCNRPVQKLWHKNTSLGELTTDDCIIVPGGFSYGDYLRSGAIARLSPIMQSVIAHAEQGGYVFGICNGFQILCEAGLLPGVLLPNANQKFVSRNVYLRVETANSMVTNTMQKGQVINMPVAHADGRFYADQDTLDRMRDHDQVLFRYCDEEGALTHATNFNGSAQHIAGICNEGRNVFGMMPHPERASELLLGCADGKLLFDSLIGSEVAVS